MLDWLADLPVVWMALVVVAAVGLLAAGVYAGVMRLAARGVAFSAVSPGMVPPMGILFALIVGFLAVGVWGNVARAHDAVDAEASALRSVVLLSDDLRADQRVRMRALIRSQIDAAVTDEWPAMQEQRASLTAIPKPLSDALHFAVALEPRDDGETVTQREIVASIQAALDARRQRIIVSASGINAVQWVGLLALAALAFVAIAAVHSANRVSAVIALAVFGSAVAVVMTMLLAEDRPFSGQLGVPPDVLEQVLPVGR